jgi:hypothetical protein
MRYLSFERHAQECRKCVATSRKIAILGEGAEDFSSLSTGFSTLSRLESLMLKESLAVRKGSSVKFFCQYD